MMELGLIIVMGAPQIVCARRRYGPAAHLTLLLLSLIVVAAWFVFVPQAAFPADADRPGALLNLTYIGFAAVGLSGLVPLFWALQQMFPTYDFAIATLLAQALGLTFTASLLMISAGTSLPSALEWAALALVIALYGAGLHVVHYGTLK